MQLVASLVAVLAGVQIAAAQTPMTAEEFDAYTRGKTLYYSSQGQEYGVEQYLDDRRVRWSYLDGECQDGEWYPSGDLICFVYDGIPDPQCWSFFEDSGNLVARFENNPAEIELYETRQRRAPMQCLGPEIGV